jgi:hypothetical protein
MAVDPGPGHTGNLETNSKWRIRMAAGFGAAGLGAFFIFALIGAFWGSNAVCGGFFPLSVVFALVAALAGAFIGGSISAEGGSQHPVLGNIKYAAAGGIAALIVVFVLSSTFHTWYCPPTEAGDIGLTIKGIPAPAVLSELPKGYWIQRDGTSLVIRLNKPPSDARLEFVDISVANTGNCRIEIRELTSEIPQVADVSDTIAWEDAGSLNSRGQFEITPNYFSELAGTRNVSSNCLIFWNPVRDEKMAIQNVIYSNGKSLSVKRNLVAATPSEEPIVEQRPCLPFIANCTPVTPHEEGQAEYSNSLYGLLRPTGVSLFSSAFAQSEPSDATPEEPEYKTTGVLGTETSSKAVLNFPEKYLPSLLGTLGQPTLASADVAEFLDLVINVLNKEMPKLTPGNGIRDLSQELKFFSRDDYSRIVELTASNDAAVRLNARRLQQRFPVQPFADAFRSYDKGRLFFAECQSADETKDKFLRYAALRYYYNRIVDYMYVEAPLTVDQEKTIEVEYQSGKDAGQCLPPDLKIDVALLDYAVAVATASAAYGKAKGHGPVDAQAVAQSKEFIDAVASEEDYAFPQHIIQMKLFAEGSTWDQVTTANGILREATVGGAAGIMPPEDFLKKVSATEETKFKVSALPTGSPSETGIGAESITAILAEASNTTFVKYRTGKTWDYGWVTPVQ